MLKIRTRGEYALALALTRKEHNTQHTHHIREISEKWSEEEEEGGGERERSPWPWHLHQHGHVVAMDGINIRVRVRISRC